MMGRCVPLGFLGLSTSLHPQPAGNPGVDRLHPGPFDHLSHVLSPWGADSTRVCDYIAFDNLRCA